MADELFQGAGAEAPEGVATPPPADVAGVAEDQDFDLDGFLAELESEAEPDSAGDGGDEGLTAQGDQPAGEQPPAVPDDELVRFAEMVNENPRAITQVPQKKQAAVLESLLSSWQTAAEMTMQQVWQEAYTRGATDTETRSKAQRDIEQIDALAEDDPEGFREWQRQNPQKAASYWQVKGQTGPAVDAMAAFQQAQYTQIQQKAGQKLAALPANLRNEVAAAMQREPQKYVATLDGLEALTELIASVKGDPARKQAAQRQAAAAHRGALPKPPAGGNPAPGVLTLERLKNMTPDQVARLDQTPQGKKAIERALSGAH